MKIDFDTSNTAEVAAVLALARSLDGDYPAFVLPDTLDSLPSHMEARQPIAPYITTPEHAADVAARTAAPDPERAEYERVNELLGNDNPLPWPDAEPAEQPTTDSKGREWDERIHSSSRATNADGTWRYKRGVDKALVAAIEDGEELPGEPQPVASVPPPPPVAPAPTESAEAVATTVADVPPPPPAMTEQAPVVPAAQPSVAPAPGLTFADLMKRIGAAKRDGTLTDAQVSEYCGALGIGGLAELASRPDLVPAFGELVA